MKTYLLVAIAAMLSSGCAMVSPSFVGTPVKEKHLSEVEVFFRPEDVPYPFRIIGKVYVKNINYWADRSPGDQAKAIKAEAAEAGADGVIIEEQRRIEADTYHGGQVYQLSGLAIVRKGDSATPGRASNPNTDGRL